MRVGVVDVRVVEGDVRRAGSGREPVAMRITSPVIGVRAVRARRPSTVCASTKRAAPRKQVDAVAVEVRGGCAATPLAHGVLRGT